MKDSAMTVTYVPVWVAEVTVERNDKGTVLNQKIYKMQRQGSELDK
jgi:hypothetical protein